MSLTVCVSASSTDGALSTTANLRLLLGATSTGTDAYQQQLIVRASRWAERYVGYPLLAQVYSEKVAGFGTPYLTLARTPIRAVLRMFDSTSTDSAGSYTTTEIWIDSETAGLLTRPTGFDWTVQTAQEAEQSVLPNTEEKPWLIEYQAGFVYPETSSTAYGTTSTGPTLPEDIEQAVLIKAIEMDRAGKSAGIAAKRVGDLEIDYFSRITKRSEAESLLDAYRSVL